MNLQKTNARPAKLEGRFPPLLSAEDLAWREFDERLRRSGDPNLIRIIQGVYIAVEANPHASLEELVDPAAKGFRLLTRLDLV